MKPVHLDQANAQAAMTELEKTQANAYTNKQKVRFMHTLFSNCFIVKQLLGLASKRFCLQAIAYFYTYGIKQKPSKSLAKVIATFYASDLSMCL